MAAKYLPSGAAEIAGGQGWTDSSIVMHLAGFIESIGQGDALTQYLAEQAADEGDSEDDLLVSDEDER